MCGEWYRGWSGDTEWHHLAGVYYPNGTISLFLDGNLTGATFSLLSKNPPLEEQDGTFCFGSNWINQFYEGRIDEFLFWKTTKSAELNKTIFLLNPRTGEYSKRIPSYHCYTFAKWDVMCLMQFDF